MFSTYLFPAILLVICYWAFQVRNSRGVPLPPGPKPLPIIGNLHQIPRKNSVQTYKEWAAMYGPVVYMNVLGREFVILNTLEAITDLFEKRSSIYSTRPRLVMAGELVGRHTTSVLFLKYGQFHKACRRQMHEWLGPKPVTKLYPQQEASVNMLLADLLDSPRKFDTHIRTNSATLILKLVYGIKCTGEDDPYITMSEDVVKLMSVATTPGRWLVDSLHWLKHVPSWMPGASFHKQAKIWRKNCMDAITVPFELVKKQMETGTANQSWLVEALSIDKGRQLTPEEVRTIQIASSSIYTGAIDTTVTTIRTFLLMMARNPEVQKKAQAEIDAVIGSHRLPTLDDKGSLPYVERLIKEVYRINATVPLVPHSLDTDDIYNGYRIPKGAWVMANMWLVFNDPERYRDPQVFNPDRYLDTPTHKAEMDPTLLAFSVGMGRRFCPGYHFAQSYIFLSAAQILSTFNISPPKNSNGVEVVPPADFDMGHISVPREFDCVIAPRNLEKARLVQDTASALGRAQ